jgi:hypothetical protein
MDTLKDTQILEDLFEQRLCRGGSIPRLRPPGLQCRAVVPESLHLHAPLRAHFNILCLPQACIAESTAAFLKALF